MPVVQLREISVRYSRNQILKNLDLSVDSGQYVVVLGASGCGKTTLLRVIAGLVCPDHGQVLINGDDVGRVPPRKRSVSFVPQQNGLYPHLSIRRAISLALPKNMTRKVRDAQALAAAQFVGIDALLDRLPEQLSGGQLKRAALAKAIAGDARVRLFDEPLSAIDAAAKFRIEADLRRIHDERLGTTIHVTHDGAEARRLADRIAVLEAGQVVQYGTPDEVYWRPRTIGVASAMGTSPFQIAKVERRQDGWFDDLGQPLDGPAAANSTAAIIGYYEADALGMGSSETPGQTWKDMSRNLEVPTSKLRWFLSGE